MRPNCVIGVPGYMHLCLERSTAPLPDLSLARLQTCLGMSLKILIFEVERREHSLPLWSWHTKMRPLRGTSQSGKGSGVPTWTYHESN